MFNIGDLLFASILDFKLWPKLKDSKLVKGYYTYYTRDEYGGILHLWKLTGDGVTFLINFYILIC